jgi:hypothetical protein
VETKIENADQTVVEIDEDEEDEDIAEFSRVIIHTVKLNAPADISDSEAIRPQPHDPICQPDIFPLDVLSRQVTGGELGGQRIHPPLSYYCCTCKFGPISLMLHPSCINCGHYSCSSCLEE